MQTLLLNLFRSSSKPTAAGALRTQGHFILALISVVFISRQQAKLQRNTELQYNQQGKSYFLESMLLIFDFSNNRVER